MAKQRKKLNQEAYDRGKKDGSDPACSAEDCPEYPSRTMQDDWREGFMVGRTERDKQAELRQPIPEIRQPVLEGAQIRENPKHFWPKGLPLPARYAKTRHPCQECRRVCLPTGGTAVRVTHNQRGMASFECRGCGAVWRLPSQ